MTLYSQNPTCSDLLCVVNACLSGFRVEGGEQGADKDRGEQEIKEDRGEQGDRRDRQSVVEV